LDEVRSALLAPSLLPGTTERVDLVFVLEETVAFVGIEMRVDRVAVRLHQSSHRVNVARPAVMGQFEPDSVTADNFRGSGRSE